MSSPTNRTTVVPRLATLSIPLALVLALGLPPSVRAQEPETIATVAGQAITQADLEQSVAKQLDELEKQRQLLFEGAIGPLVDAKLIEVEAAAHGMNSNQLISTEVTAKIAPVTDAQVDTWFEQNKARLAAGSSKEELAGQIKSFLEQERGQSLYRDWLKTLRAKHETRIFFEPPRSPIDLSTATWKGNEAAAVTVVEFSDFQCPACRGFNPILNELLELYPDDVRVAFLHYPLHQIHPQAQAAAEAALCARDAGKFWEMHDAMFADQRNLGVDALKAAARGIGLDPETFDACLDEKRYEDTVLADVRQAAQLGASGTPSVYVNGRTVSPGRVPTLDMLASLVEDELRRSPASTDESSK